jgi:ABC-type nitrate/sulfonate/bicarbonate transport system substrate-binding protein
VHCVRAPDYSLPGFAARPRAVAAGTADFALTSVAYLLAAQAAAGGCLPVRFAAISHQRNPICGVVRDDSSLRRPDDLAGRRAASWSMPFFARDYAGAMAQQGIDAPVVVDVREDLDGALGRGDIDVIPTWVDMVFHHRNAGFAIRAIPLDIDVYTTGMVAADRLAPELVARVRDAFVAGYEIQLAKPELGITGFQRHFPDVSTQHIRASWAVFEPYAFDRASPGTMEAERWEATIAYTAETHGLPPVPGERLYRPELLIAPTQVPVDARAGDHVAAWAA